MKIFIEVLNRELEKKLLEIQEENIIKKIEKTIQILKEALLELKLFVLDYSFLDDAEEIYFFKVQQPQIYGQLLYYKRLLELIIFSPTGSDDLKRFYEKELNRISLFFDSKRDFIGYWRSNATYFDERYFLRSAPFNDTITSDIRFATIGSIRISRTIANEMLIVYIEKKLDGSDRSGISYKSDIQSASKTLSWTDPKTALIEMAYSFKAKGTFNNGKATLKEITDYLQQVFNIELTNPSRDFQEILRRKTGYTNFLDSLRENYLKYIDAIESKDRK